MKHWLLSTVMLSSGLTLGSVLGPAQSQRAQALDVLKHFSVVELDDGQGGTVTTLRITGVNLQIVNGLGATNGNPADPFATEPGATAVNGAGNLILGYGELPSGAAANRTGSHYLVVGPGHSFSGFGGAVLGDTNRASAPYASVLGGQGNRSTGRGATVSGGEDNTASGLFASVGGGTGSLASGDAATVGGGIRCLASGTAASVSGGYKGRASGDAASVSGGDRCEARGTHASVSGGSARVAQGTSDWAAGSLSEGD